VVAVTQRFLPGLGRASYTREEDELCRALIADGRHDEVRFLHELKVTLDAAPLDDDSWHRERQAVRSSAPRQEALI
jgi:hypothetical protein